MFTDEKPFEVANKQEIAHNMKFKYFREKYIVEEMKYLNKQKASGHDEMSN